MSIGRDALVDNLNRHSAGLNGWQSLSTRLRVKLAHYPATTLVGVIACKSPNYFRLKADNPFAKADLGSNASKCWAHIKPGEPAILTWDHEDTNLIQKLDLGVPFIDPNWLMLVLGITPLDASEYQLGPAPNGKPELWLTAMKQSAQGQRMKRVVKVDTLEGVVREHAVYDDANNAVVRAVLTSHQPYAGYLVPGQVHLIFPATQTELTLSFNNIETNPVLPDQLWHMPGNNLQVVDLGMLARQKLMASGQYVAPARQTAELISHTNELGTHDSSMSQLSGQANFQQANAANQTVQEANSFEAFMASEQQSAAASDTMSRDRFFAPNDSHAIPQDANLSALEFDSDPDAGTWESHPFPEESAPLTAPDWDDPVPRKPSFFSRMLGR